MAIASLITVIRRAYLKIRGSIVKTFGISKQNQKKNRKSELSGYKTTLNSVAKGITK